MSHSFRKGFIKMFLGFTVLFSGFAFSPLDVTTESNYEKLKSSGSLQSQQFDCSDVKLSLLPKSPFAQGFKYIWPSKNKNPALIGENLYLIPKSKLNSDTSKVTIEKASQIIRSISKMQGMQYYSNGEKRWTTLYKDAYCIKGPKDKTRVSDNTLGNANGQVQYCLLNDNSLGKTNYKLSYRQSDEEVSVEFENVTSVSIGPITGVSAGNLRIGLDVIDCGDDFLVYTVVIAKYPSIGLIENKLKNSFSARLSAIYNWFINQF
ncbi:MAG: hypothetical protein MR449_01225 [Spirochaetia bacterium]|nr:hypothetical protein [Spirochaetia bacterium]